MVPTVSHVTVRPVLTGAVREAGTVQARVTALFFMRLDFPSQIEDWLSSCNL